VTRGLPTRQIPVAASLTSLRLPDEVFLSAVFQNMSGPEIDASDSATNAGIVRPERAEARRLFSTV
jgi:hypothetical protein